MSEPRPGMKRYNLVLLPELYEEVAAEGKKHGETFVHEVRHALKLWLMVRRGEVEVVWKDGGKRLL